MSDKLIKDGLDLIKSAIHKVVVAGPDFLNKKIQATEMAHTMVNAVEEYAKQAEDQNLDLTEDSEARELLPVLQEIYGCGSGFLQNRCDSECVAGTIKYIVSQYGGLF